MDQETAENCWTNAVITTGYSDQMPFGERRFNAIGGDMGTDNADFEVSEIPAYMPSGTGEHVYLWIEKYGKSTMDLTKAVQKAFEARETDVGCAGKKDVHAITRQWISVQTHRDPADALEKLREIGWLKVLQSTRHTNKLHMWHLRGNRFGVQLYGVQANDGEIQTALDVLSKEGFINYFGKQRFGFNGDNIAQGMRVMAGAKAPHHLKKLYISAVQSAIFNLLAGKRFEQMGWNVCAGDVMQKLNAGCFVCDDPETDLLRAQRGEILITLPLIGKKYMHAQGMAEQQALQTAQLFFDDWQKKFPNDTLSPACLNQFVDGTRRPFAIRPDNISFQRLDDTSVHIEFVLPAGSYATIFLRHLCGCSFTR